MEIDRKKKAKVFARCKTPAEEVAVTCLFYLCEHGENGKDQLIASAMEMPEFIKHRHEILAFVGNSDEVSRNIEGQQIDIRFWMLATIKVAAKRTIARCEQREKDAETLVLQDLPAFGMF